MTAVSLLEHASDAAAVVKECARVTKNGGRTFVLTTNRFSIAPEPHVRVWGVGFLPRSWMPAYVKWRRGIAYENKRLLSIFELRRFLKAAAFDSIRFSLPVFMDADVKHAGIAERIGARWQRHHLIGNRQAGAVGTPRPGSVLLLGVLRHLQIPPTVGNERSQWHPASRQALRRGPGD